MNILFIGKCSTFQTANEILNKTKNNPGFQIIKFINLILEGFRCNHVNIEAISNVNAACVGKKSEFENGIHYQYIPSIQVPILCQIAYAVMSFYYTFYWGLKHKQDGILFCDIFSSSSTVSGSVFAAKLLRIPICALVTDMITTPLTTSLDTQSTYGRLFFAMRKHKQYKSLKQYDLFVFLTKFMAEIYNPNNRPYIIMEGSVDHTLQLDSDSYSQHDKKIIMYAGAIEAEYGFNELVQAFMKLSIQNIELHIYGGGKFVSKLLEYQKNDSRIKYMGIVSNEQVVAAEKQATILVNPRLSNQEFAKYSFPSKTSEYMVSGTPLVTTKLPGIPDEYFEHLYLFEEESIEGFAKKMQEILSLPYTELRQKGRDAQEFVLKNKNNIVQTKKIINFFTQNIR